MSCKYCDPYFGESVEADASERLPGEPMEVDFGFLGTLKFALYIERDVLTLFTDDGGVNCVEKKYAINYCPMCGRKVREKAK